MESKYQERSRKTQIKENEKLRKSAAKKTKQAKAQMTTPQPNGKNSFAANNLTLNSSLSFSGKHSIIVLQGQI